MKLIAKDGTKFYIDEEDYELIKDFNWGVDTRKYETHERKYIQFKYKGKKVNLHRLLMGFPKGLQVDHKDNDPLNNRRSNLRTCTTSQNNANGKARKGSSKYKGVYFDKACNKWRSKIRKNGRIHHIGYFKCETKAAKAYDAKALELYGEFARTNEMMGLLK